MTLLSIFLSAPRCFGKMVGRGVECQAMATSIERFKAFMIPLTAPLGRSERRVAAACYVQGLLMPGQRKSIETMAEKTRR
jgi:hypothetical protein